MSRRCSCRDLHAALATDPRLRTIHLAARMLWLHLATAVEGLGGVLPFSSVNRVSLLVSASVTDVETHLPTLLAEGLVLEEAGTLIVPLVRDGAEARASRTRAAQENGRNGGRPRRGETPEAARHRRSQTTLPLPIQGGRAETQETQVESSRASDSQTSSSTAESHLTGEGLHVACERLAAAAGFPATLTYTWTDPKMWLARGHTVEALEAEIKRVASRANSPPGSWRYFQRAIDALPLPEKPRCLAEIRAEREWQDAMREWQDRGGRGPMPALPARAA